MFDFIKDPKYLQARDKEDFYFFGKVNVPIPTWNEILAEFDREYNIHLREYNTKIFKQHERLAFVLHKAEAIPIVDDFLRALINSHVIRKNQQATALAYISLSSESSTYGNHVDVMDVWCWQMQGRTFWRVEGKETVFEKILEPGELIYVPRGIWHYTQPITPRAGLSFGSEDKMV